MDIDLVVETILVLAATWITITCFILGAMAKGNARESWVNAEREIYAQRYGNDEVKRFEGSV